MNIFWQDEFDKEQLNTEFWNYDAANAFPVNCGGDDKDVIGKYTGDSDHLWVEDGKLHISATFDPVTRIYRTSRINSRDKVNIQYGRIDFRAKLAAGNGLASSLMMIGEEGEWPAAGEIDVIKMAGKEPGAIIGGLVYEASGIKTIEKKSMVLNEPFDLTDHFHIYTILWEENRIHWLRDYELYFTVNRENFPDEYIFNTPFFIKINLAVGGYFAGLPELNTEFPCSLVVDYIRVYQPITGNINE
jgi:beta-glucanase (GH16 family)